jgi:hypothetical protein
MIPLVDFDAVLTGILAVNAAARDANTEMSSLRKDTSRHR